MPNTPLDLRPVDLVEVFTLVDNYSDVLLPGTDTVIRPALAKDGMIPTNTLLAEHGLSLLVKVHLNGDTHSVLLDTGYSNVAAPHNLKLLGLNPKEIEAIVMSHGHMDHSGALKEMIGEIGPGATGHRSSCCLSPPLSAISQWDGSRLSPFSTQGRDAVVGRGSGGKQRAASSLRRHRPGHRADPPHDRI